MLSDPGVHGFIHSAIGRVERVSYLISWKLMQKLARTKCYNVKVELFTAHSFPPLSCGISIFILILSRTLARLSLCFAVGRSWKLPHNGNYMRLKFRMDFICVPRKYEKIFTRDHRKSWKKKRRRRRRRQWRFSDSHFLNSIYYAFADIIIALIFKNFKKLSHNDTLGLLHHFGAVWKLRCSPRAFAQSVRFVVVRALFLFVSF